MKNTKLLVILFLVLGAIAMVLHFWDVLMTFVVAGVIAYLLYPAVRFLSRHMRRGFAVLFVMFLFVFVIGFIISISLPAAVTQIGNLVKDFDKYAKNFDDLISTLLQKLEDLKLSPAITDTIYNLISQSDQYISSFLMSIVSSILNFSLGLFDIVVVLISVVYFLLDGGKLLKAVLKILPDHARERTSLVVKEADTIFWAYIRSHVIISFGMGVVTYIGLTAMGIRYAALFAVMSFILDFIPYFGSILSGVVVAFYALLTSGLPLAIGVTVFIVVVQQIEGNIVMPRVSGNVAGIHPLAAMFAVLACNQIWGPFGMLMAVPVAGLFRLFIREVYYYLNKDSGGDHSEGAPADPLLPELEPVPAPAEKGADDS